MAAAEDRRHTLIALFEAEAGKPVPSAHKTAALAAEVRQLVTYLATVTAKLLPPEPDMAPQMSAKHVHAANVRWHGTSSPFIRCCVCLAGHRVRGAPGVFVAGDMGRGQSLIVWAIAEGRAAAAGVDRHLIGGDGASCADQAHRRAAALTTTNPQAW
jgi:NADPH-dependent glutamate synthase beta subunit-like oxidoreductase